MSTEKFTVKREIEVVETISTEESTFEISNDGTNLMITQVDKDADKKPATVVVPIWLADALQGAIRSCLTLEAQGRCKEEDRSNLPI